MRRLADSVTILDSELVCTREANTSHSSLISGAIFQRGSYTLVGKINRQQIVGHFRLKSHDHLAQIVFIAPTLEDESEDTAWLHLIDAMASEAGKRGAHMLTAEVDECTPLFKTMRSSGFAVYARQELWRGSLPLPGHIAPAKLVKETSDDTFDIQVLYSNIVPRLVQPIAVPSHDSEGYVYREEGRARGYVAVSEGKNGVYLMPFLHPDIVFREAASILAGAIYADSRIAARAERVPIYVCVRRYQDWLESALQELGFEPCGQQAVMVRHIAAGIRQPAFAPLAQALDAIPSAAHAPGGSPTHRISRISEIGRTRDFVHRRWNVV
jgi:hypothetical protein